MGYCTCYDAHMDGFKKSRVHAACFGDLFSFMEKEDDKLYTGYVDVYIMDKNINPKGHTQNTLCLELDDIKYLFEKMNKVVIVPEISEATFDEKVKFLPQDFESKFKEGTAYKLHFEFKDATQNRIRTSLILSRYAYESETYYEAVAKKAIELSKQFEDIPMCEIMPFAHQLLHCGDGHTICCYNSYPPISIRSEESCVKMINDKTRTFCTHIFAIQCNQRDYKTRTSN